MGNSVKMIKDYYGDVKPEMAAEELTGTSFDEYDDGLITSVANSRGY